MADTLIITYFTNQSSLAPWKLRPNESLVNTPEGTAGSIMQQIIELDLSTHDCCRAHHIYSSPWRTNIDDNQIYLKYPALKKTLLCGMFSFSSALFSMQYYLLAKVAINFTLHKSLCGISPLGFRLCAWPLAFCVQLLVNMVVLAQMESFACTNS